MAVKTSKKELKDIMQLVFEQAEILKKNNVNPLIAQLAMINARLEEIVRLLGQRP